MMLEIIAFLEVVMKSGMFGRTFISIQWFWLHRSHSSHKLRGVANLRSFTYTLAATEYICYLGCKTLSEDWVKVCAAAEIVLQDAFGFDHNGHKYDHQPDHNPACIDEDAGFSNFARYLKELKP